MSHLTTLIFSLALMVSFAGSLRDTHTNTHLDGKITHFLSGTSLAFLLLMVGAYGRVLLFGTTAYPVVMNPLVERFFFGFFAVTSLQVSYMSNWSDDGTPYGGPRYIRSTKTYHLLCAAGCLQAALHIL